MGEKVQTAFADLTGPFTAFSCEVREIVNRVTERFYDSLLHRFATSKEWHYYKHSKKLRTRMKYKRRIERRLDAKLQGYQERK